MRPWLKVETMRDEDPTCLYCGCSETLPLWENVGDRLGYVPGRWAFRRCPQCQSAMLQPVPEPGDLLSFYPPIYSFAPDLASESRLKRWLSRLEYRLLYRPMYASDARRAARHTRGASGTKSTVLDVGCGRGLRLLAFRRLGYEVCGADFQPEVVGYLERTHGIEAVCSDIVGLPQAFAGRDFDLVTAYYAMEHVLDVQELLGNCLSLLKPGGWFVGAIPLSDGLQARWFGPRWSQATEAPRHISLPSQDGVRRACRSAGFENISIVPDSLQICATAFSLSVVPGSTTWGTHGQRAWLAALMRFAGIGVSLIAAPCCWIENYVLRKPSMGVVFAQKPLPSDEREHPHSA